MSDEKHYDYYTVTPAESKRVYALYRNTIEDDRRAAQKKLLDDTGAVGWGSRSSWGEASAIDSLAYPVGSPLAQGGHIKFISNDKHEGEPVVLVRGKYNRKKGRGFNRPIEEANKALAELPNLNDWLVRVHYKINRTGTGGPSGRGFGTSLLSTSAGFADDKQNQLVFRIPNGNGLVNGELSPDELPKSFQKLTYGQWYDLVEGDT